MNIKDLKFDEKGLIPVVVQDYYSDEVLTVAYMNKESLDITIKEGRTCFWSRSRNELWRKGETSGNVQHVVSITSDCDNDALVVKVIKDGPACHLGSDSCFSNLLYLKVIDKSDLNDEKEIKKISEKSLLSNLYDLLNQRYVDRPEGSYTTYLFDKGLEKILKKVGEESAEVVIGAMKDDKEETIYEISDLCYHILVLMVDMGISVEDVLKELDSRHIIDKKVKQETMK
ncbi:bifunctional phosphoribosyl-AMP cyclohydrolase/phosphoribosyl-ATP diphosphatase HisIE [Peptostreptococcus faecalis]|uniref:bifunctional phosphoribosyl-AMP cyclohydrolase/phosphoribosyl-ATP diphosphatase HisIE n=1 Tax=Peptostreptococcus faecalis TaxID=2045015 RepID=UPI000C7C8B95|nr:bifunctional phosphoribosyl-AMP cyclohydrolase/phosphoribosyl-ATP diphosphatase HisIE [Peptostreptococcus faecalis]